MFVGNTTFQAGQIERTWQTFQRDKAYITCTDKGYDAIKFENIFTAFVMLLFGIVSSILIGLYEYSWKRAKKCKN